MLSFHSFCLIMSVNLSISIDNIDILHRYCLASRDQVVTPSTGSRGIDDKVQIWAKPQVCVCVCVCVGVGVGVCFNS